jgi:hypothetical protein
MDKSALSTQEQIEYYLGKDRLPNLHWQPGIFNTWNISPGANIGLCNPTSHSKTIQQDSVSYQLNNLGYRSHFDFDVNELKNKEVILILADSDGFGRGVEQADMYATKIQNGTDMCVVNLSIPRISSDGVARVGVQAMLALESAVKHVCVLWPIFSLREFVSKNYKSTVYLTNEHLPYKNWWDQIDWVSNNYNYQKNKLFLEQTAGNIGAKYHDLIINRYDKTVPTTYNEVKSRDITYTELSVDTHTAIANYYLRKINNQPSLYQQMQL